MVDHGARDHARWAASSTARNWGCPGALTQVETITTPEKENRAAAWGTACHQVSEKCLRTGNDATAYVGTVEKTKQHSIDVDDELADTAQQYVDYCRGRIALYKAETGEEPIFVIEQNFRLDSLSPPYDSGGTGDFVIYFPRWRLLEIVDLKGGRGVVVEVEANKQLRTYGLGAVLTNPGLDVDRVMVTIVQPRAPHKDGRIRSETFHIADLVEWTADLLAAMRRSKEAQEAFGTIPMAAWVAKYLVAGDHCKFCRAAGFCQALEQRAMDAAGVWFNDEDQPQMSNAPSNMAPAELSKKLDLFDMIQEWMNAVRAYAHEQAELGVEIPEYQLSNTIGHRKFKDEAAAKELLFLKADLSDEEMHNKKFKSPAQIEKALGAKKLRAVKTELDALVERPVTGTNLVRTTKTTRPATTPAVNKHFAPIED
jgi:hypothetical protein